MYWRSATYIWLFCTFGWGLIWALTDVPAALMTGVACGAMTYYSAWRHDNG